MNWDYESLKRRGLITTGFHLPYNPDLVGHARLMRKALTSAEKKLWEGLLRDFKFRVLRQRPIDNFIVDFYCPKLKLVIEIDGAGHFKDEGRALDKERTEILVAYGLRVVRFSDHDVMIHFTRVCDRILAMCS
ncbi:MAG: endonuclease domain-containing protein [Chrysiogenia bacterium]